MKINLKEYAGKLVVVTLRNEWMIVSNVYTNEGSYYYPYSIDNKNYSNDGQINAFGESQYDIVDIALAEKDACETPKSSMTNCYLEGEPPNGCPAWNVWYEEFGSRGILNNLKISSLNDKPEPVITRVEVITDTGRDYVCWEDDNIITTSLQDEGRTLKVFVTKNTEEPEMPITKPEFYNNLPPGDKTLYRVAEKEVSNQWATALSNFIDELGGDSPALWEWKGITPTPEKVVECLREDIQYLQQLAADEELGACVEWVSIQLNCTDQEHLVPYLREYRRPKPTLKSQALKDFETVRKHSDLLPEILDTIEKALKSIPDT